MQVNINVSAEMGLEDTIGFGNLSVSSICRLLEGDDEFSVSNVHEKFLIRSIFRQLFHHKTTVLVHLTSSPLCLVTISKANL